MRVRIRLRNLVGVILKCRFFAHAHKLWKRRQFLICLLGRERERRLWCSSSRSVGGSLSVSGLLEKKISYKSLFLWFEVRYSTYVRVSIIILPPLML